MADKRLSRRDISTMVKLRGLGYSQKEIAERLGVTQSAVQYQLKKLHNRARKENNDEVFMEVLLSGNLNLAAGVIFSRMMESR